MRIASCFVAGVLTSTKPLRVLVVDDDEDSAMLLAESLADRGHTVEVAHDGPSALSMYESFVPEVALLDVGLPLMDGFEVARRLRALEKPSQRLRLFAITGYDGDDHRRLAREAGFDLHLVKPVMPDRLMREIEATSPESRPAVSGASAVL